MSPAVARPWLAWSARLAGLAALLMVLGLLLLASLAVGSREIDPAVVWRVLWRPDASPDSVVIWQLRLPRSGLGVLVGMALGLAGSVMQAISRNPLADPGLLGVNAGASFAVVAAISLFGIGEFSSYVWWALAGAIVAVCGVYALSSGAAVSMRQVRLVLAGTAVSASLGACTGIITLFDSSAFDSYRFWVVGSLDNRSPALLAQLTPLIAAGSALALAAGASLNSAALGDDLGRALGVRLVRLRLQCFVAIALLCGAATAAAGPIGFVGLVIPHAVRLLVGPDWRWRLVYAAVAGPVLLLASDILGRVIARPGELEVGIVTAFIGAPVLLWLVSRQRGGRR